MEVLKIFGCGFITCGTYITLASLIGFPNYWEYGLGVLVVGAIMILIGTRKK